MKILLIILGILVLGAGAALLVAPHYLQSTRPQSERNAAASLKTLATAEADFRSNDRDRNGKLDFWRADVAGLYTTVPKGGAETDAIKLIEISIAAADNRPVSDIAKYLRRGPKSGYWYRAIRHMDELALSPKRFAFCAFPDTHGKSGKWTLIIDEENTIYKTDLGRPGGIELYPLDPLKEGWQKMD